MLLRPHVLLLVLLVFSTRFQVQVLSFSNWRFTLNLRQYERVRDVLLDLFGRTTTDSRLLARAARLQKLQPLAETPFPCRTRGFRSVDRPWSVHRLRPGDIDVVAAMGDSLTAANAAAASSPLQVLTENRGISWVGGGQGTWRQFLTVPNILKVFNPKLIGYALSDSLSHHKASQFNVADAGAKSSDLPFMVGQLIKRMRSDPRVNLEKDWKLINVNFGSTDFCMHMCYEKDVELYPERHRSDLTKALQLLQRSLPRTLVQIILAPHLGNIFKQFKGTSTLCQIIESAICPCLFGLKYENKQAMFFKIMRRWQQVGLEVAADPRFMDAEDFAVVAQPFSYNITFPSRIDYSGRRVTDFSYISEDCFHFSQKTNAKAATALWNNMLQPVGAKSTDWGEELKNLKCPSEKSPYIFTNKNS